MFNLKDKELEEYKKRPNENKITLFHLLIALWFVFISFHFYYLIFSLSNNGLININELMNTFKIKIIMNYLWIVIFPTLNYYLIYKKIFLSKPLSANEKGQIKLTFKGLCGLFIVALFFTLIF